MTELETVEELAESIADVASVYGCLPDDTGFSDHPDICNCRICFVESMKERIYQAVENDQFLNEMRKQNTDIVVPDRKYQRNGKEADLLP